MTDQESEKTILEEAAELVSGPRRRDYDSAFDNFTRIANMWTELTKGQYVFQPEEVALFMIAVKLSREVATSKRDNLVDIAGYAQTHEFCVKERKRRILNREVIKR